jgi:hypothetical protein
MSTLLDRIKNYFSSDNETFDTYRFSYDYAVHEQEKIPVYSVTICTKAGEKSFECNHISDQGDTIVYRWLEPSITTNLPANWSPSNSFDESSPIVEVSKENLLWAEREEKSYGDIFTYEGVESHGVYVKVHDNEVVEHLDTIKDWDIDTYIN